MAALITTDTDDIEDTYTIYSLTLLQIDKDDPVIKRENTI